MNNTNQINNNNNKDNEIANKTLSNRDVFSGDDLGLFIFQRTEKISSAIYMLTGFLSDKEPMKWSMRQLATTSIMEAMNLSKRVWGSKESFNKLLITFSEISSLFYIANLSKMISLVNYEIIQTEIKKMTDTLSRAISGDNTEKSIFADNYFDVVSKYQEQNRDSVSLVGHFNKGQKDIKDNNVFYKNSYQKTPNTALPQKDKNNRQEMIISLLKDGKVLTIKDFSSEIKDCSEKTIQRELLALVSKNVLKKEGERRWSRYSLV